MAIIYMAIGFLIALFLPNKIDDLAKALVKSVWKKLWSWINSK